MMLKNKAFIITLLLALSLVPPVDLEAQEISLQEEDNYVIEGDKVRLKDITEAEIEVWPHTLGSSGYFYFNITSKSYFGDSQVIIFCNDSKVKPKNLDRKVNGEWFSLIDEKYSDYSEDPWYNWNYMPNYNYLGDFYGSYLQFFETKQSEVFEFRVWMDIKPEFNVTKSKLHIGFMPKHLPIHKAIEYDNIWLLDPWIDNSYAYRKKITFDSLDIDEDLVNFPVIVKFNNARLNFSRLQSTGNDSRFIDKDNSTYLPYQIEYWNQTESLAWLHVRVPQIDKNSGSDYMWYYYGNALADHEFSNVWGDEYRGVWHHNETNNPSIHYDDTAKSNDGNINSNSFVNVDLIDTARYYNLANQDYTQINDSDTMDIDINDEGITIEVFFNNLGAQASGTFFCKRGTSPDEANYCLRFDATGKEEIEFYWYNTDGGGTWQIYGSSDADMVNGVDYYIAVTYDHIGNVSLYRDGELLTGSCASGNCNNSLLANNDKAGIGIYGGVGEYLGYVHLDELRLMDVNKSAEWIKASSMSYHDTLLVYGLEEEYPNTIQFTLIGITGNDNKTLAFISGNYYRVNDFPVSITETTFSYDFYSPLYETSQKAFIWNNNNSTSGAQSDTLTPTSAYTILTTYDVSGGPLVYGVMGVIVLGVLISAYWGLNGGKRR